jgi:carboxymethylenebutenolidase
LQPLVPLRVQQFLPSPWQAQRAGRIFPAPDAAAQHPAWRDIRPASGSWDPGPSGCAHCAIEDVARRLATEGFLALAPDGLAPAGGYPGNDDDGRTLQSSLDQAKLRVDLVNSARYLKALALSNGKLGATGFCFGGGVVNYLAVTLGAELAAGVPFYGAAPDLAEVPKIKAALLIPYAATDERINAQWPAYEAALKANRVTHEAFFYEGTQHGFHNNSTPRYHEATAKLAWDRTLAHFRKHLAAA